MSRYIKAKKYTARFISLLLILCILISLAYATVFDKSFYKRQYIKNNIPESTGIKLNELMNITSELLDYIRGNKNELDTVKAEINGEEKQVFNNTELAHMVDVRSLFDFSIALRDVSILLAILLAVILILCIKNIGKTLKLFAESYLFVCKILALFVIIFVILGIINFTVVWDLFHYIFFSNDLWMLDPDTDIMILMLPEEFFSAAVLRIVLHSVAVVGLLYILAYYIVKKSKISERKGLQGELYDLLQKND